tara:strand:- start:2320 stop:2538 length:219 start_codon:yes stop_codon:yes gene_type:complete
LGRKIGFHIEFDERELIVEEIGEEARRCGITVEQLIKRFIVDAMEGDSDAESIPGETMADFLVKNGVLTPKK